MAYDLEKYRDKREKVLGVKKKGISFGTWAATVSAIIIVGLISMVAPKSIAYFSTRNLDDVIYKLSGERAWPQDVIHGIATLDGVKSAIADKQGARLVVTFDRINNGCREHVGLFQGAGIPGCPAEQGESPSADPDGAGGGET